MRYAVLSDVHGNLHALRAVVEAVRREGVDGYLCLGDLVGYGPAPNECVEVVADLGAVCVAGNHDLIALGELGDERCGPLARQTNPWTREVIDEDTRRYLAALPPTARVGDVVLAHGAPGDPQKYVTYPDLADRVLDRLVDTEPGYRVLAVGHTHVPWAYARTGGTLAKGRTRGPVRLDPADWHLLNPGSVGQSRDRSVDARYLVLDVERGEAALRAVAYDVRGHVAALRRAGLPAGTHHLPPTLREGAERVAAKVGRRAAAVRRLLRA
ncbi:MAG TPA: metallophosphoesterase family protein [Pseudonocardia sp.]|jgi:predicted phosphodiesterase|nr:metallophosphoesterase family protein [Pseudonocardia sp.]